VVLKNESGVDKMLSLQEREQLEGEGREQRENNKLWFKSIH